MYIFLSISNIVIDFSICIFKYPSIFINLSIYQYAALILISMF